MSFQWIFPLFLFYRVFSLSPNFLWSCSFYFLAGFNPLHTKRALQIQKVKLSDIQTCKMQQKQTCNRSSTKRPAFWSKMWRKHVVAVYSAYFVLLHFYHDAKKVKNPQKQWAELKKKKKRRSLFTGKTRHRKVLPSPLIRLRTDLTHDCGNENWNENPHGTDGCSAHSRAPTHTHTHMYVVDLCIYSSYPGGVQNLSAILTRHSSISIIAQALEFFFFFFPTVYINFSSRRPSRWRQQLRYKPLVMNKIYILKNNPSTTATSGHQIHKKTQKKSN